MSAYRQQGFSLLEVLVAFSILAVSLGALFQVFATGMRNTALSEEYSFAALHAESVMATIGTEVDLESGALSGELDDTYAWRVAMNEYIEEEGPDNQNSRAIPYWVQVEVYWQSSGKTRSVVLNNLRLAARDGRN